MKKNFLKALFLVAIVSLSIASFSQDINVKLGKSGCHFSAGYSYNIDKATACIVCDSVRTNAHRIVKRFYKKVFKIDIDKAAEIQRSIWLGMPNKQLYNLSK